MSDPPADPVPGSHVRPRWVKAAMVFGFLALLFVVLSVTGVLPGGLGGHGPGRHSGDTSPSTGPQLTSRIGGPVDPGEAARSVQVTTSDTMIFEPSEVRVKAGEAVTFVVTNAGQAIHEFTLGNAAMQQEHAEAMAHMPDGMAHDNANSITVQPGETQELTWRFGDTPLEYACHQPGHLESGMQGRITIT